jgi:hypothetical protein
MNHQSQAQQPSSAPSGAASSSPSSPIRPRADNEREGGARAFADSHFWRGMAVLFVAALLYIGHGLAAQNRPHAHDGLTVGGAGAHSYLAGGGRGSSGFFTNAAFADGDTLLHVPGGDVDIIVTAIDGGETLLMWIFGSVVNGIPELDRVVRFAR